MVTHNYDVSTSHKQWLTEVTKGTLMQSFSNTIYSALIFRERIICQLYPIAVVFIGNGQLLD